MGGVWVWITLLVALVVARPASAAVERYAVLIGSNRGAAGEADLRYAEADAESMYAVLKDVGSFRPENMLILRAEPTEVVQRSLIAMNDRVRAARSRPGTQVVLFVYYSGHADALAIHLQHTRLEITLLEQLVRSSAAEFRHQGQTNCKFGTANSGDPEGDGASGG